MEKAKYLKSTLNDKIQKNHPSIQKTVSPLISNFTPNLYFKAVGKAKDYIKAGDIYQVNLSQRFNVKLKCEPFDIYLKLRKVSPSPFATYLNFNNLKLLSSSPERFLRLRDNIIETRPMKGTRPRGKNKIEDKKLRSELKNSEKDKAELVMIVDLLRNDIGKVSEIKSVRVKKLRTIEPHPTVYQSTSTIISRLLSNKNWLDLLLATFPGGSITGCPKIRAMEIIEELEPTKRNIYTGALGYIDFSGDMDLSMIIRTITMKKENDLWNIYLQVGGGIVADSSPEKEYEETLHKAYAMFKSLKIEL
jgi:para-aminobenzoate synthetase component 1